MEYDIKFATLYQVVSTVTPISQDEFNKWADAKRQLVDLNMDSLDVVELSCALDEALGNAVPKDTLDELSLSTKYEDLSAIFEAYPPSGCPVLTTPHVTVSEESPNDESGVVHIVTSKCKFGFGQNVRHVRNQDDYVIIELPCDHKRLEESNEPYYRYRDSDGIEWSRKVSEMEDGRFVAI